MANKIQIPRHPVFKDFAIVKTISGTFICPGWHPVPPETTREDVELVDTVETINKAEVKSVEVVTEVETFQVKASKGDKYYTIVLNNGKWSCDCPASQFFSGNCKHIKEKIAEKNSTAMKQLETV